jgi:hypothetical protein
MSGIRMHALAYQRPFLAVVLPASVDDNDVGLEIQKRQYPIRESVHPKKPWRVSHESKKVIFWSVGRNASRG